MWTTLASSRPMMTPRDYASLVAVELIKNREIEARHWRIERGQRLVEIAFISHDKTLGRIDPSRKEELEQMSAHRCALSKAIWEARALNRQARAVVAKSRGRPYLAADKGEEILGSL